MKKLTKILPWLLVAILATILGLIVYMYVYTYTGKINDRTFIPNLFFGGRVEALNSDLDKYGIRDLYREKVNFPLQSFEVVAPLSTGRKNIVWDWQYLVESSTTDLENEATQFAQPLEDYCNAIEDEMNEEARNEVFQSSQLRVRVDETQQGALLVCNLDDTSQIGFSMILREVEAELVEDKVRFKVFFDSLVRER